MKKRLLAVFATLAMLVACQNHDDGKNEIKPSNKKDPIEIKKTTDGQPTKINDIEKGTYQLKSLIGKFAPSRDKMSIILNQQFSNSNQTTCKSEFETEQKEKKFGDAIPTKSIAVASKIAFDGTKMILMDLKSDIITLKTNAECSLDTLKEDALKFYQVLQEGQANDQGFSINIENFTSQVSFKKGDKQFSIAMSTEGDPKSDIEIIYEKIEDEPKVEDHSSNVILDLSKLGSSSTDKTDATVDGTASSANVTQALENLSALSMKVSSSSEDAKSDSIKNFLNLKAPMEIQRLIAEETPWLGDLPSDENSKKERIDNLYKKLSITDGTVTKGQRQVILFRIGEGALQNQFGSEANATSNITILTNYISSALCREECDDQVMAINIGVIIQKALEKEMITQETLLPYFAGDKVGQLNAAVEGRLKQIFVGFGTKIITKYTEIFQNSSSNRLQVVCLLGYHLWSLKAVPQGTGTVLPETVHLAKAIFKTFLENVKREDRASEVYVEVLKVIGSWGAFAKELKATLLKYAAVLKSIADEQNSNVDPKITDLINETNKALRGISSDSSTNSLSRSATASTVLKTNVDVDKALGL